MLDALSNSIIKTMNSTEVRGGSTITIFKFVLISFCLKKTGWCPGDSTYLNQMGMEHAWQDTIYPGMKKCLIGTVTS
jgi:hypothetical protein